MSDDDIERLLREVDATMAGSSTPSSGAVVPVKPTASGAAAPERTGSSPVRAGLVAGAVSGVGVGAATLLFAWLPFMHPLAAGCGAFVGAFLTGAVLSWRNRR
jgi:hypothetical protein